MNAIATKLAPTSPEELRDMVKYEMRRRGNACDLNHLDVSALREFCGVFAHLAFNGNIDQWDVSQATSMRNMFFRSKFNGDISKWNVANVRDMVAMFQGSAFNGDVSNWDVRNVSNFTNMFREGVFAGDLSQWNIQHGAQVAVMVPVGFINRLPRGSTNYIVDFYATALGGYKDLEQYLARATFNRVHASIALFERAEKLPLPLRGELFEWLMEQRQLQQCIGIDNRCAPDVMVQMYHAKFHADATPDNLLAGFDL